MRWQISAKKGDFLVMWKDCAKFADSTIMRILCSGYAAGEAAFVRQQA